MYKVRGQTLGDYCRKTFTLPTSTASVAPAVSLMVSAKKGKCGCAGSCGCKGGHGLNSPQRNVRRQRLGSRAQTSFPPRLNGLGDDSLDSTVFNTPNLVGSPDFPGVDLATTGGFGPQPTQDTLNLNLSQGLAPGTAGTVSTIIPPTSGQNTYGGVAVPVISGVSQVLSSIFGGASRPAGLPGQQSASALTTPQAALGGLSYSTILIGFGAILVLGLAMKGRR